LMDNQFIRLSSWPRAILRLDAFFASCEQAIHTELRGRPVITGKERGIRLSEVKKICPDAVILPRTTQCLPD
ncbi:MAG TPA: hypothetical protein VF905_02490, partial [Nitrospirota bacterium]